uniref:Fcf2 domain-containing protein n=1 Tax=Mesocestoides corti TaxID=53468 RepID=A0A5K3FW02_MESCO
MDVPEDDLVVFSGPRLWKPPVSLTDCSSEYLKDNPIPYYLLKNPFGKAKTKKISPAFEKQIWDGLGILNNPESKIEMVDVVDLAPESITNIPSLYYAKSVPPIQSRREVKRERKALRKAKLSKWFDLPRGDLTQENKDDLEIISKRRVLGLDLHTRKADGRRTHFQVGTVVDDPGSFYDRIPRKQRKKNLVDELLANAEYMKKQRRQYAILQKAQQERRAAILRKKKQQLKKAGKTKTVEINE